MKNYPASTGKELDKTTTLICCVFGGVMVVAGVLRLSPYPIAIGVILMAAAILSLAGDPGKCAALAGAAREAALARHDKERIVAELIHVYETLHG